VSAQTSETNRQLKRLLETAPDADANKDGILVMEEALAAHSDFEGISGKGGGKMRAPADGDTALLPLSSRSPASGQLQTVDLRCECGVDPMGIDVAQPLLSWRIESNVPGQKQSAYRVIVSSSPEKLARGIGDLWDSGRIESEQSQYVVYSGEPLRSRTACFWKAMTWDKEGRPGAWSPPARWTMGLLKPEDWTCQWISAPAAGAVHDEGGKLVIPKATYRTLDEEVEKDVTDIVKQLLAKRTPFKVDFKVLGGDPAPGIVKELVIEYLEDGELKTVRGNDRATLKLSNEKAGPAVPTHHFRKDFKLAAAPDSAYVTVHSPAYFELYVNGEKVGADVLSPAVSNDKKVTYSLTYDVSRYLKAGNNCIGLWMGTGWASEIVVRAQLDAVVNGEPFTLGTDPSWKTRPSGRYRIGQWKWGDFGGELVDAREEMANWCRPEQDASSWKNAVAARPNLGPVQNQPCPANRLGEPISPVAVTEIGKDLYELDFGKALTGWFRLEMPTLEPGATVTMTFADTKSELCKRGKKIGGKDSYQTFEQISQFISAGKPNEVFQHKFNYAAFRYVIVKGLTAPPAKESAQAMLVDSDLEIVGSFECSNPLLNRIHEVNAWTQRCLDLGGYYVDCPHRERMGYGDGQVAAEGFMSNFRADGFYRKWLGDWRNVQQADGSLKNSAPFGKGGGGPAWGGLLSAITWRHYLYYGDVRVLKENYNSVKRYVDYLEEISRKNGDILTGKTGKYSFIGDWVAPGRGMDSKDQPGPKAREIFNNCYRINQMNLLVNMAKVLGKDEDAAAYARRVEEIRPKIHEALYDPRAGHYVIDEQAYYVMPLMTGVVPDELQEKVFRNLEENILEKNQGHLDTGMLGTYFMMEYLREIGRSDLVFTMFNQKTYPGWGYMIEKGTTTFWEQWNGYWSHIHSCFTSPDNWLYQGLAGIQADPAGPGFKKFIIKPELVGDVTWVKAHHDSPYGRVVSNWKREGNKLAMQVSVPPNTTATVYVTAADSADVRVNGVSFKEAGDVTLLKKENGRMVLTVTSGRYEIVSPVSQHSGGVR
jgi:alpha-L-rhamnosidase